MEKLKKNVVSNLKEFLLAKGEKQKKLFYLANREREKNIGRNIYFRGIIEFSNTCEKNCYYCGIRKGNKKISRFFMSKEEIFSCIKFIDKVKYGSLVFQSGEITSSKFKEFVLDIVSYTRRRYPDIGITLSIGEQDKDFLRMLKKAGAIRYLLRIETASPSFYKVIHPSSHLFMRRVKCLENLKELGYQVGTGNMIGLPGQTINSLMNDLEFFHKGKFDMYGLGPYVIHRHTPIATRKNTLYWQKRKDRIFNMTLNFISLLRILCPKSNIASATAMDVFHPLGRVRALSAGANVIMPSVTPRKYRDKYLLYQNKPCIDENAEKCSKCITNKVRLTGLTPLFGVQGNSLFFYEKKRTHNSCIYRQNKRRKIIASQPS